MRIYKKTYKIIFFSLLTVAVTQVFTGISKNSPFPFNVLARKLELSK